MTKASAEECDEQVRGVCLSTVAHAMLEIGEQGRAREIISECLETLDHFSDPDVKVEILCSTASASYKLDDVQTYWECVERAFETCPTIEDRDERDSAYTNIIGVICETEGDVETIESALLRCTKLTSEGCSDALDIIRESLANQDPSKVRRTFTYNPFDLRSAVGAVRSLLVAHAKTDGRDTFDSIAGFCPALRLPFNLAQHS